MTSWLPRYEAKCVQRRCFQWGSVPLHTDIKRTELPPWKYIDTTRKAIDCTTTMLLTSYYCTRYSSAVLGVVILSVHPSVRPSICPSVTRVLCDKSKEPTGDNFISDERAIILVFWCQRSQRNSNGVTPNGGVKERWGRLKRRFSTNIPWMADRLKCCQLSSPVSVKLLTVGGNVDHTYRRELYSAARPSRRNGFYRTTQLC